MWLLHAIISYLPHLSAMTTLYRRVMLCSRLLLNSYVLISCQPVLYKFWSKVFAVDACISAPHWAAATACVSSQNLSTRQNICWQVNLCPETRWKWVFLQLSLTLFSVCYCRLMVRLCERCCPTHVSVTVWLMRLCERCCPTHVSVTVWLMLALSILLDILTAMSELTNNNKLIC